MSGSKPKIRKLIQSLILFVRILATEKRFLMKLLGDADVKKRVKNKLYFILCQDKAFEDKMNCQFQRVS
jgi:hypothetical protein